MDSTTFPSPQGARSPVSGPLPARNQSANGISSPVLGGVRRKRGPAGRETTHPLTITFPQRPDSKKEQKSNPATGPATQVGDHGFSLASSAPISEGSLNGSPNLVSGATDLLSLQPSPAIPVPEKAN